MKLHLTKLALSVSEVRNISFRYMLQLLQGLALPRDRYCQFPAYSFTEKVLTQQFTVLQHPQERKSNTGNTGNKKQKVRHTDNVCSCHKSRIHAALNSCGFS